MNEDDLRDVTYTLRNPPANPNLDYEFITEVKLIVFHRTGTDVWLQIGSQIAAPVVGGLT